MIYNIAGLKVEIHGVSLMEKSKVCFVKESPDSPYTRKTVKDSSVQRDLSPSGEGFSPDGISVYNDENEQFLSNIGNEISAEICGSPADENGESLYVLYRLSKYKAGAAQGVLAPDFSICYKILPEISKPEGEYLGDLRGFSFYREENGFFLNKKNS